MANEKLNAMHGYFCNRGLLVRVCGVEIRMRNKSAEYEAYEERERQKSLATTQTETTTVVEGSKRRQQEEMTNTAVHDIQQKGRIEEEEHKLAMARSVRKGEIARQKREQEFEAQDARDAHELGRKDREKQNERDNRLADMKLDEELSAIAVRIENSCRGIREKLDAYARLQRQADAEDRDAGREAQLREDKMCQPLQADDARTEEICRAFELWHKQLGQGVEQLKARFENERTIAAEQEARHQAREEIVLLRQILEYLTTQGDHQVTQESLREALEEANRQREAAGRKEEAEREARRRSTEQEIADCAAQITENVEGLQRKVDSLQNELGEIRKDNGVLQTIIYQLNAIRKSVDEDWCQKPDHGGKQGWLDNLMEKAPRRSETRVYDFPTSRDR